ncbi:MAG: extracellular solute-binding protein [Anaerolineaceae bacterium]|nr:MAG: extracellular solute-binding protein [Anaerolineaceae bacterium]
MKKNLFKRLLTMVLIVAMLVGALSACGRESKETVKDDPKKVDQKKDDPKKEDPQKGDTNDTAGTDGWTAFDKKVTLRIGTYDRGAEGVDPVTDNGYTRYVQEQFGDKYNVELVFVPITRSDVMTDYALLAAVDDLPNILMEYDYPKVSQWANDGYLQTIDLEAFAQVAPTYYQRMVDLNQLNYTKINGEDYFILAERPYYNTTYTFINMVRMDWLEQVGYDHVPANYDEYCDAMQKIIDAGIAEHPQGGKMITEAYVPNFGFRDYPVNDEDWAMHSSLGTASLSWGPTKKLIKRANAEYHKGFINPEYFTIDVETEKANFINGKTYKYGGYMTASVDWLNSFYAANPDAKLAVDTIYSSVEPGVIDFPQIRSDNPYGMTIGFGKDSTSDELKAAWMYMEWCTLNIKELQSHPTDWNNFNNSKDFWCVTIESVKADTIEASIGAISPKELPKDFTQEMIDNYHDLKEVADAGHAYTDPAYAVAINAEAEYNAALFSLYVEYYDNLVMCEPAEFDKLYDELSKAYLDAGYKEIIDERLAAYKAGSSTKLPR